MTHSEDFAKAIAFAWWLIFKMVSFLEYLLFFRAVFCTEQLEMICRMDCDMFFGILIFDPKWWFWKGYSLCMMGDFQNDLIFGVLSVFSSGFLNRSTLSYHMKYNYHFKNRLSWKGYSLWKIVTLGQKLKF